MSLTAALRRADGRRRHALALATTATALISCPAVAHATTTVEAETLVLAPTSAGAIVSDAAASGGKAEKIWSNGAGSRAVDVAEGASGLVVRARGEQCGGAPRMVVSVDGVATLSTSVASTAYADVPANGAIGPGAHTLKVAFVNDYRTSSCDRNLVVDSIRVQGGTAIPAPAPAEPPAIALETGFEARGGSTWTSQPEEQSYLRALDAASSRVSVAEIARSVENRPIQLVTVGAPRTKAEIAAGSSILFVCTQHGNEPAGREACLEGARTQANASDATTILIIPTANPDGVAHTNRHNADGVDINRDHLTLRTPEARAIAAVIRDYKPDLLGDMHEYSTSGASRVLFADPERYHLNIDAEVKQTAATLLRSYVVPAETSAAFGTGLYSSGNEEADETVLRQQSALRHTPSLLVETPRLGTLSPLRRVKAQSAAIGATIRMIRENTSALAATTAAAQRRATAEGAAGDQRYYYTSPNTYSDTPPCGYRLTDSQYRSVQGTLALHGVSATPEGGTWIVSAAQGAQPDIGLLLDSRAPHEVSAGQRLAC